MQNVHLASEDIYSGYNDYNPSYDTENLEADAGFQQAVRTSHGRRPPMTGRAPTTAAKGRLATNIPGRAGMPSSMGRPTTGAVGTDGGLARPMTSVRAAGYTSGGNRGSSFDPLHQRGPAPPLEGKNEDTPEEKIKQLEKKVNELIEESCFSANRGELNLALEKAKEAGRKERILVRQREQMAANDQINLDLTYSVLFNLANMYEANEMFSEALNTYQVIVKNKMFSNAGRLKVNMGNIYFKQRNYPKSVKFYRMALDQVPNTHKDMRIKIMQNIGVVFVKMGQYSDAITSFEHIMGEKPDFRTAFNLILCYFAIGDRDKMKRSFQRLLQVDLHIDDEDKYLPHPDDQHANMVLEAIKNDTLRQEEKKIKSDMERYVMASAKIIAPAIEQTFAAGYDWCVDCVKSSLYTDLANDLEINKAVMYLKQKDTSQAIETLKGFEKKDSKCASAASTNLSFLYFLQNDYQLADKYAEMAIQADRYNPYAMVNKGNCLFAQGDYEKAKEYYQEAGRTDSSCTEALYNLGLTNKKINLLEDALDCFLKLHAILRNSPQVLYHLATLYEMLEDSAQASEWFMQLIGVVTTDPGILARLGEIYDNEGDKSQAFQYHYESYRYFPSNIEIIEWLGAYYIDSQFCEKAIHYFERAAVIQPTQSKWQLMIASCHRRSGNYQQALETYKHIHKKFPENIECLKFLVRLCTDMGLTKDAQDYATKLKKAEKSKEVREQRANSATRRSGSGRGTRTGSAGSDSGRTGSGGSGGGSRSGARGNRSSSGRRRGLPDTSEPFEQEQEVESDIDELQLDASYLDPLGPSMERPKTAARSRDKTEDDFADEELGEDLLPE